jgi:putative DNA primase/helicase
MGGDEQMLAYLQRCVGYTLTGDVSEQCLFFLHGKGQNGKSTFAETVQKLLGDYMLKSSSKLYTLDRYGTEPETEIARLFGKRLVTSTETEARSELAESRVKDLTGGDTLSGRELYQKAFNFQPMHKLWIYGNHRPNVSGNDKGIWRRIKLIPFEVTIPDDEKDPGLMQKLEGELPGILIWAVKGCLDWQKRGLCEPSKVTNATKEYREEEDILAEFVSAVCLVAPSAEVNRSELYAAYRRWKGFMPLAARNFNKLMESRGEGIYHRRTHGLTAGTASR